MARIAVLLFLAALAGPSAAGDPRGGDPGATSFSARRLDPDRLRLVRRLYFDLAWRGPTPAELEAGYARDPAALARALLAAPETWETWLERQLYYFLLLDRFRPKEGRLRTIPARIAAGRLTVPRALEEIVRSQYFNARNPGNDTFVTVVLEQCLGLVVQKRTNRRILEAGKRMYDGYRTKLWRAYGDSQADFVRLVFAREACLAHLLRRTWRELHGTDIGAAELAAATARLASDRSAFPSILADWLAAGAYREGALRPRRKAEIPYVRTLFLDTLGRLPTYDELRNVRNAFLSLADPTPIRLVMGRVLLASPGAKIPAAPEPGRFVDEQFLRLLGRQPTGRERRVFAESLREDPAVTPRVVVWTLLSSPEYQTD